MSARPTPVLRTFRAYHEAIAEASVVLTLGNPERVGIDVSNEGQRRQVILRIARSDGAEEGRRAARVSVMII